MTIRLSVAVAALVLMMAWGASEVRAASELQCQVLQGQDFSSVIDAPTHLMATRVVEASDGVPAYCQVKGYVAPSVEF